MERPPEEVVVQPLAVTIGSVKDLNNRTPLGRLGTPEEIGQAIAFLASDWATFITGETLFVDGGWMAYGGAGDVKTF